MIHDKELKMYREELEEASKRESFFKERCLVSIPMALIGTFASMLPVGLIVFTLEWTVVLMARFFAFSFDMKSWADYLDTPEFSENIIKWGSKAVCVMIVPIFFYIIYTIIWGKPNVSNNENTIH